MKVDDSVSLEQLKRAAEEKNARTSEWMRDWIALGDHPWQQPEFIKAHSKHSSERMRDLIARGDHPWQQPKFITAHSKRTSEKMNTKWWQQYAEFEEQVGMPAKGTMLHNWQKNQLNS